MRDCKTDVIARAKPEASQWRRGDTISTFARGLLRPHNDILSKEYLMTKYSKRTNSATSLTSRSEFNPDYTYVKRDLLRIGRLAGSFFAILIALSFFLK